MADTNGGAHNLRSVSVPILILHGTADEAVPPAHIQEFIDNITHDDWEYHELAGVTHYFEGKHDLFDTVAKQIHQWLDEHNLL